MSWFSFLLLLLACPTWLNSFIYTLVLMVEEAGGVFYVNYDLVTGTFWRQKLSRDYDTNKSCKEKSSCQTGTEGG